MQFFSTMLMSTLALSSIAIAAPMEIKERQSTNPFSAVTSIVGDLEISVSDISVSLISAVDSIKNTVTGDITAAETLINSDFQNISSALADATTSLTVITTTVVNGAGVIIVDLTQTEVNQLTTATISAISILSLILEDLQTASLLDSEIETAISSEEQAVITAIELFVSPLDMLANTAQAQGGLQIVGLVNAVAGLESVATALVSFQLS